MAAATRTRAFAAADSGALVDAETVEPCIIAASRSDHEAARSFWRLVYRPQRLQQFAGAPNRRTHLSPRDVAEDRSRRGWGRVCVDVHHRQRLRAAARVHA